MYKLQMLNNVKECAEDCKDEQHCEERHDQEKQDDRRIMVQAFVLFEQGFAMVLGGRPQVHTPVVGLQETSNSNKKKKNWNHR